MASSPARPEQMAVLAACCCEDRKTARPDKKTYESESVMSFAYLQSGSSTTSKLSKNFSHPHRLYAHISSYLLIRPYARERVFPAMPKRDTFLIRGTGCPMVRGSWNVPTLDLAQRRRCFCISRDLPNRLPKGPAGRLQSAMVIVMVEARISH